MCTVSFVANNGKIFITSNRDEQILRESAIEPKNYLVNDKNIIFPKDRKAGGTWYALNEDGVIIVLLNGAEEKHQVKPSYRKSRGLIVLDLISSNSPILEWEIIDLNDIEPFTIILFQQNRLYQLRWNELKKEKNELSIEENYIWSSSTLYSSEIRNERAKWFYSFLEKSSKIDGIGLLNFHRYTESQNDDYGLIINRNDFLKTVSITQTVIELNKIEIHYIDLLEQKDFSKTLITI